MSTPVPASVPVTKGKVFIGPKGDRRIRLVDLAPKKSAAESLPELTLSQILLGDIPVEFKDKEFVTIRPLNLKGMAGLESYFGSLSEIALRSASMKDMLAIVRILINQELPLDQEWTDDDVARRVDATMLPGLTELIERVFAPLPEAPNQTTQGANGEAPDGPVSSSPSPESSGGPPTR